MWGSIELVWKGFGKQSCKVLLWGEDILDLEKYFTYVL